MPKKVLKNISEIRRFFHTNKDPVYFVSATNFNLLGLDEWVMNFTYICYMDCFDGRHPNVFVPSEMPHDEFQSIEDINNYLLQHKEVIDLIKRRGGKPKFVFLMFDETTEKLVKELGGQLWDRLCQPDDTLGIEWLCPVNGLGSGKSRAFKLVASVVAWEDLRCLCFRSRQRVSLGFYDLSVDIGI